MIQCANKVLKCTLIKRFGYSKILGMLQAGPTFAIDCVRKTYTVASQQCSDEIWSSANQHISTDKMCKTSSKNYAVQRCTTALKWTTKKGKLLFQEML